MEKLLSRFALAAAVAAVVILSGCAGTPKAVSNWEAWRDCVANWASTAFSGVAQQLLVGGTVRRPQG